MAEPMDKGLRKKPEEELEDVPENPDADSEDTGSGTEPPDTSSAAVSTGRAQAT
ncbi:MAG: hypothetical protein JO059_12160, partial [Mycobacterium sp.]|nr:hypothetical protein [Mycobacterium sp.]